MSGLVGNPFLLTSAGAAGYQINRSLRFNSSDSAYCSRTFTTPTASNRWTWAGWIKRVNTPAVADVLFSANYSSGLDARLSFASDNTFLYTDGGGLGGSLQTAAVYRDFSSWMHVVFVYDSPNATSTDRLQLYINGTRITTANGLGSATYPTQNTASSINGAKLHTIGQFATVTGYYANMYLADVHFIDGQALTPSSFTEVSATTGRLEPKQYTGSFGTNGFWLKFSDNSAATATTLGKDYSGNNNNWTPNNFAVGSNPVYSNGLTTNGSKTGWFGGTPAQAFDSSTTTFVQGALGGDVTFTPATAIPVATQLRIWADSGSGSGVGSSGYQIIYNGTTIYNQSAMWTSPYTISAAPGTSLSSLVIDTSAGGEAMRLFAVEVDGVILVDGAGAGNDSLVDTPTSYGTDTGAGGEVRGNYCTLNPLTGGTGTAPTNGNLDFSASDQRYGTIGISSGKWYWEITMSAVANSGSQLGISNKPQETIAAVTGLRSYSSSGNKYDGSTNTTSAYGASYTTGDIVGVAFDRDAGTLTFYKNGSSQGQAFSGITSDTWFPLCRTDAGTTGSYNFGQRPFAYPVSGFKALCDTNLPAPTIAKPSTVMDVKLYTGNGSTQTISGLGFSPDLVWLKKRGGDAAQRAHQLFDTIRGSNKALYSNLTDAEFTDTDALTAFNSDGFTLGVEAGINTLNDSLVAWTWDAGASTVTNTSGSISSQVRANASAGFSVVSFTGAGGSQTVGHGLGVTPAMIIAKNRATTNSWAVWFTGFTANEYLVLNSTGAKASFSSQWGSTPTSTVFGVADSSVNGSGNGIIAYCFAPVAGYSAFGSYTGNGSADGPFVYTGFRPRWVLIKGSSFATTGWAIFDAARNTYNVANNLLLAESSGAESSYPEIDILSNGFKLRGTNPTWNYSGQTHIYAAFAENPFQYARAR